MKLLKFSFDAFSFFACLKCGYFLLVVMLSQVYFKVGKKRGQDSSQQGEGKGEGGGVGGGKGGGGEGEGEMEGRGWGGMLKI